MAIYIPIIKVDEDDLTATYHYGRTVYEPDPKRKKRCRERSTLLGRCYIDKRSGEVERVSGEAWDDGDFFFVRVRRVLQRNWEQRAYPDRTDYAA